MIRVEESRHFAVDRALAFDYITAPRNWPHYWPDLVAIEGLDQANWREPGDVMRLRMRLMGRTVDLRMTLDHYERPSVVRYHTVQPGLPDAAHERHFERAGDGLVYRVVVTYTPRPGFAGLLDRTVVRRGIRRALRKTLDTLARRLRVGTYDDAG